MKKVFVVCLVVASLLSLAVSGVFAQDKPGKDLIIYAQMGGTSGDPSTLPRENGAKAAEAAGKGRGRYKRSEEKKAALAG